MRQAIVVAAVLLAAGCQMGRKADPARLNRIAGVYDKGDITGAIDQLNAYVKEYPKDDLAWTILGNACEDVSRDAEAGTAYAAALALNPRRSEALVGQAILHRKQGRNEEAMRSLEHAVEVDPKNAHAYSSMTMIALQAGDNPRALEYAAKGYELDATDAVIAANLAVAYHYNGDLANRDKLTQVAQKLGYPDMNRLQRLYSGQISVR